MEASEVCPQRARGAVYGAAVMSGFGSLWLAAGLRSAGFSGWFAVAMAAILCGSLWAAVAVLLRRLPLPQATGTHDPAERERSRRFAAINVMEGLAIFLTVNVLGWLHLAAWTAPAVALIVGLHFLPLARLFAVRAHLVTGAAVMACALAAPLLPAEVRVTAVCLGAGLILWVSAIRAVVIAHGLASPRAASAMPGLRV